MSHILLPKPEHADAHSEDAFTHREIAVFLLIASMGVIALGVMFYPTTLEDAHITFRYAEHYAAGRGMGAWNHCGERVEGYTTLLWMVLLGWAKSIGVDVCTASKVLGIASHLAVTCLFIAFPLLRRRRSNTGDDLLTNPNVAVLAGLLLATYLPLSFYAASGMETAFFAALVGLFFISLHLPWRAPLLSVFGVLLILTRPEGALIVGVGVICVWLHRDQDEQSTAALCVVTGVIVTAFGALLIHRVVLFGDIVPNTYWAKAGGATLRHVIHGLKYVANWLGFHGALGLLAFTATLSLLVSAKTKAPQRLTGFGFVLCILLGFGLYIVKVGGDNYSAFPYWRHCVHLFPLLALLSCYAITSAFPRRRHFQILVLGGLVVVTNLSALAAHGGQLASDVRVRLETYPAMTHAQHNQWYTWVDTVADDDTTIASSLAGELPYIVDAIHIDILGLNTRHIAKHGTFDPAGPQDSKTDMNWVLAQKPDIIEGYFSAQKIIAGVVADEIVGGGRRRMNVGLVSSPVFQQEYMFVRNAPYSHMDRALFVRRSYWLRHPMKDELDCVPVLETTLGGYHSVLFDGGLTPADATGRSGAGKSRAQR